MQFSRFMSSCVSSQISSLSTCCITAGSPDYTPWVIIVILSIAAVIISVAIYGCYVKYVLQMKDFSLFVSVNMCVVFLLSFVI